MVVAGDELKVSGRLGLNTDTDIGMDFRHGLANNCSVGGSSTFPGFWVLRRVKSCGVLAAGINPLASAKF